MGAKTKEKVEEKVQTEEAQRFAEQYVETPEEAEGGTKNQITTSTIKELVEGEAVARIYDPFLYKALIPAYLIEAEPTVTAKDGKITLTAIDQSMIMAIVVTGRASVSGEAKFKIPEEIIERAVRFRFRELVLGENGLIRAQGVIKVNKEKEKPITIASKYAEEPDPKDEQIKDFAEKYKEGAKHKYTVDAQGFVKVAKELSANGISSAVSFIAVNGKLIAYEEGTVGVMVAELSETLDEAGFLGKYNSAYVKIIGDIVQKLNVGKVTLMFGDTEQPMIAEIEGADISATVLLAPMIDDADKEEIVEIVKALI